MFLFAKKNKSKTGNGGTGEECNNTENDLKNINLNNSAATVNSNDECKDDLNVTKNVNLNKTAAGINDECNTTTNLNSTKDANQPNTDDDCGCKDNESTKSLNFTKEATVKVRISVVFHCENRLEYFQDCSSDKMQSALKAIGKILANKDCSHLLKRSLMSLFDYARNTLGFTTGTNS